MTVTLLHGDCLVRMAEIPDGSVDMILCDLPYGTTACKWDNVIPFEPLWKHYWRVLKPNGAVVLFGSEPFSSHLRMSQITHYKYDWIWDKKKPGGIGIAKYQPLRYTENISVFYRKTATYIPQMILRDKVKTSKNYSHSEINNTTLTAMVKNKTYTKKYPSNVLEYSNANQFSKLHPTQKPVALLEYLIRTYTLEGETVLDNTMGSGSTGVACVNTGRNFIGIEQDEKYFEIAQKRIAEAQTPKELWS